MAVAGGDGGIGDKGEVVPKHPAAQHGGHAHGRGKAGGPSHGKGNGGDEGDGSHRGAHGQGDKAAHHEKNRHGKLGRDDGQKKVGHAVCAAPAYHPHKQAGGQEDENHDNDILIAHAFAHEGQLFLQGKGSVLAASHKEGDEKDHHNGDAVKPHGNLQPVLKEKPQAQIEHQKHPDGEQCLDISFLHRWKPPAYRVTYPTLPKRKCPCQGEEEGWAQPPCLGREKQKKESEKTAFYACIFWPHLVKYIAIYGNKGGPLGRRPRETGKNASRTPDNRRKTDHESHAELC